MKLKNNRILMAQLALQEDVRDGDLTAGLIPEDSHSEATVVCRESAILAGQAWFDEVFKQVDTGIEITWHYNDGDEIPADSIICTLKGRSRSLLTGERSALNFVQNFFLFLHFLFDRFVS